MNHPLSTLSNLAYIIAGAWVIADSAAWLQDYAGIMILLLGIASGAYHWLDRYWAQKADIIAIYGAFNAVAAWQLSTFEGFTGFGWLLFGASLGLSIAIGATYKKWHHEQIGALALVNLLLLAMRSFWLFLPALVLFLAALKLGQQAEQHDKRLEEYDQPHAIWHILTATAILLTAL